MPTRLIQLEQHSSGTASFQIVGAAANQIIAPEDVTIAIVQPGAVERYLDPRNPDDPWTTSIHLFKPIDARRQGSNVMLDVDVGVTFHLRANQPYKLRIRQFEGMEADEVFTCPGALRRPSAMPPDWSPSGDRNTVIPIPPPPPPPPEATTAPTRRVPDETPPTLVDAAPVVPPAPAVPVRKPVVDEIPVSVPGSTSSGRPSSPKWLWPLLLFVVLAGAGGGYFFWSKDKDGAAPAVASKAAAPQAPTLESIRKLLATTPDVGPVREQADALAKSGKLLDGQFLLYKYAAEKGDRESARIVGGFYDPDTWTQETSPMPAANPTEAVRWLKQAAEAGDAEAQYRYAMLLKKGRTDEADGPEQSVAWLRKAADQGHEAAGKAVAAP